MARRHALAAPHRVGDATAAAEAMTVLHATEPATVHLSVFARTHAVSVDDVDDALYGRRSLAKQLAMRRTLFVFPRDLLPAAWASASARVAGSEARRVAKVVQAAGLTDDGAAWLERACAEVLAELEASGGLTTQEVRARVPLVAGTVATSPGSKWGGDVPLAPWILTQLGLRGLAVRGHNAGHWRLSRARWTPMHTWLGDSPAAVSEREGYAELVRRWLRTFGPGTAADVQWWLGSTKTAVTHALADVEAVEVDLDDGQTGWVLPDDVDSGGDVDPWAALLPVLDPTTMGWRSRDFYLRPDLVPYLVDSNGNAGTTAWWNGRIVGCWTQDDTGVVQLSLLDDVSPDGRRKLQVEADRLTAWLDGIRIGNVYASRQMKAARLP